MADTGHEWLSSKSDLVECNTRFAIALHRQLGGICSEDNIFVSPFSVSVALAMCALGANGETMQHLKNVMCLQNFKDNCMSKSFKELISDVANSGGGGGGGGGGLMKLFKRKKPEILDMANRIYAEKSFDFKSEYNDSSRKYFGTDLGTIDIRTSGTMAAHAINAWISEKTRGNIPEITDSLLSRSCLVVVSAICLKPSWDKSFTKTQEVNFEINDKDSVQVSLMHMPMMHVEYGFHEKLRCQAACFPFANSTLCMVVILPMKYSTSYWKVERHLASEDLMHSKHAFNMRQCKVNVWLPNFKFDRTVDFASILTEMGAKDLFDRELADLLGMSRDTNVHVTSLLHRARLEVNQDATEVETVDPGESTDVPMAHMERFMVDRPFLYFIQDETTKSVLFLGRLVNPLR